ncbi:hypothetical protein TNCV_749901 [Trichonephila clavipes]|nr:hypothetical protein TNCV_749901 [Trichonephila clavipes]
MALTHWSWEQNTTNYDSEVTAFCEAAAQLLAAGVAPVKAVSLTKFQAAISAISSNTTTDCLNTIQCRHKIAELISYGWTVALK